MDTIMLIRHGEAEHNVRNLTGGWSDTSLTEQGMRQAKALAERLGDELGSTDCAFYCSDLKRAYQTAKVIKEKIGLEPTPSFELRELNLGVATGKTIEEVASDFRPPTEPLIDWQSYPEAETWRSFYRRVSEFMDHIHVMEERPILIVAHSGTIINVCGWWIRLEEQTLSRTSFHTSVASLSVLNVSTLNERTIERLNDTAHLFSMGLTPPIPVC